MRLIYFFNGRLPTEKAHGLQIIKMCEAFSDLGILTELVVPFRANPIKENCFTYYGIKKPFTIRKLWSVDPIYIKGFPGRLAFFVQNFSWCISLIFYLSTRRYSEDTIFYARDYASLFILSMLGRHPVAEMHDYRFPRSRFFVRVVMARCRRLVLNSEGTLRSLQAHYEIDNSKTITVPNGVDINFFDIKETKEEARNKLNIPRDRLILGYIGRLETAGMDKGAGLIIEAITILNRKDISLYIVGGPDSHVEYFKEKVRKLDLERQVIFTSQVAHALIPRYLRAMDVVILPLATGQHALTTSPIKLFEYMAAGKVIVASDLPSIREIIDSSEALLFKPGDARDLAAQIDRIVSDPNLTTTLAQNSLKRAQQYSWYSRAQAIKEFIITNAD